MGTTKNLVGSALQIGIGSAVLNEIPGGSTAMPIMTKSANMMGVVATASYAKDVLGAFKPTKKSKSKW